MRVVFLLLMLKKITIALVAMIYALASTGAIVHLDYCCGKLSNISLAPVEETKDQCKKDILKGKTCCDSKQVHLLVKGEQELGQKPFTLSSTACAVAPTSPINFCSEANKILHKSSYRPPPLYSSSSLFIKYSVFRI